MSNERILFKNILFMILSMILPNVFNLVMVMIGARILLNAGMNDYNVVLSFVAMFLLFSDIGTGGILIRDGSRDGSKISLYFGNYFAIRVGMTCLTVILCLATAFFMPYTPEIKGYIVIMVLSQVLFQASQIFVTLFQARQKMEYIMYGNVLQALLFFAVGWMLIGGGMGVVGLIYASLLSNLALFLLYVVITQFDVLKIRLSFDWKLLKYLLLAGLPFGIVGFLNIVYSYIDRFILSILRYSEVANYTMSYTLVMSLTFILLAYNTAVFPMFSKIFASKDYIRYACEMSLKYLVIIIFPMCVGITLLADRIVFTIYGYDFAAAIPVLRILVWLLLFMVITYVGFPLLTATHRERLCMWILVASSTANIILNIALIPSLGAIGSSIASLLTIGLMNAVLTWYAIRKDIRGMDIFGTLARVPVAAAAMVAAILLVNLNNLLLYVILGMAVYFIVFIAIGGFSRGDLDLFRRIFVRDGNSRLNAVFDLAGRIIRV